jgi:hypothetical protein
MATMKALRQMLLMVLMLGILTGGAFAQKGRGGDQRQKEDPPKIKVEDKKGPPPDNRQNENRGGDQRRERP